MPAPVYLYFLLITLRRTNCFLQLYHVIKEHKVGKHKFEGMTYKAVYDAIMRNIDAMNEGADEKYRYHAKKLKTNRRFWHKTGRHVNPFIYISTNLFFPYLTVNQTKDLPRKPTSNLFLTKATSTTSYILPPMIICHLPYCIHLINDPSLISRPHNYPPTCILYIFFHLNNLNPSLISCHYPPTPILDFYFTLLQVFHSHSSSAYVSQLYLTTTF